MLRELFINMFVTDLLSILDIGSEPLSRSMSYGVPSHTTSPYKMYLSR
jgi:hypothetical protein